MIRSGRHGRVWIDLECMSTRARELLRAVARAEIDWRDDGDVENPDVCEELLDVDPDALRELVARLAHRNRFRVTSEEAIWRAALVESAAQQATDEEEAVDLDELEANLRRQAAATNDDAEAA